MVGCKLCPRGLVILSFAALLTLSVCQRSAGEEPKTFESRKQAWEKQLDELLKKPPNGLVSDPLQSLDINNFQANCTVQFTYSPEHYGSIDFRFLKGGKELISFPGHFKTVFAAKQNILVFVSYGQGSNGATATAYDLNAEKELWNMRLDGIGRVKHFAYSNEVSMAIFGAFEENSDGEVFVEGHESSGSYMEVRDLKTGKLLAHRKITNEEYQRRNNSTEK